nr:glycosyltransferase [Candidatus Pacearchaeota archaeon]
VIVDTGSVDGTRQELEQLAAEFPNLRVYDRPFDNYASARNHSLALVPTKRALVLDVDELLGAGSIAELSALLSKYSPQFLHMVIRKIFANGKTETGWGWNTRLFENNNVQFRRIAEITGDTFETWTESLFSIEYNRWAEDILDAPRAISYPPKVEILHFKPSGGNAASTMKMKNWYRNPQGFSEPPSQREGFKYWKQPNSHREKFK